MKGKPPPASALGEYLLTPDELAKRWNISRTTIERWRFNGEGPPPVRITGGTIRYKRSTVERYEAEHETF